MEAKEWLYAILIVLIVVSIAIPLWIMQSYYEAKAFNSVTGKNVSTWEAMWIELRVQEPTDYLEKEN